MAIFLVGVAVQGRITYSAIKKPVKQILRRVLGSDGPLSRSLGVQNLLHRFKHFLAHQPLHDLAPDHFFRGSRNLPPVALASILSRRVPRGARVPTLVILSDALVDRVLQDETKVRSGYVERARDL